MTNILALISVSFIVISAILIAFGWSAIRRGKTESHVKIMITASVFATLFFILYLSRTVFIGNTTFGGPDSLRVPYGIFLFFHIVLATIGGVMGILSLYYGYKRRLDVHKKIGPWTSWIWFFTAITGVIVYLLLYVIYEPGQTDSMFKAIFGW